MKRKNCLNLYMFEDYVIQWLKRLSPQIKTAWWSTLIFGLLSHGTALFNKFSIHDDVSVPGLFGVCSTYPSGRWMLGLLSDFEQLITDGSHYSMPLLNGILSLVLIAITVCLIADLLEIKSRFLCLIIGGIMGACPIMAALFGYVFTAPYYNLALLMTVGSAFIICKIGISSKKSRNNIYIYILALFLFAAAIGIYQAYIPVFLSILLIFFILQVSKTDHSWSKYWTTAIFYCFTSVLSVLIYFILNKYFLYKNSVALLEYMGINEMGQSSITEYIKRIPQAYKCFFCPELFAKSTGYFVVMGLSKPYKIFLGCVILLVSIWLHLTSHRNPRKVLQLVLPIALLPLAFNFIFVMSNNVHALMIWGFLYLFVFTSCIVDLVSQSLISKTCNLINILCIVCCTIMLYFPLVYCRYDNALYMEMTFAQERTINYFNVLISQIKNTEGYKDEMPILYIGFDEKEDQTLNVLNDFYYIIPYNDAVNLINNFTSRSFINHWCGYQQKELWASEYEWAQMPEVMAMPCYPDSGSIRIIDDVIVVKFS